MIYAGEDKWRPNTFRIKWLVKYSFFMHVVRLSERMSTQNEYVRKEFDWEVIDRGFALHIIVPGMAVDAVHGVEQLAGQILR